MKSATALQHFKKCIILFMVGTVCSALAYAIYVINPVKLLLESKLQMKPGSMIFSTWRKPPIDVYLRVYIFNITNPVEFLNGEEKLRVQEIGPYVYQEFLENVNITWNDNGTISYYPKRHVVAVPEMSVGDPMVDFASVPNVPMLGAFSALHDAGFFKNFALSQLVNALGSKPILNITVYDYLWGYEDSLVRLAHGIVPNFLNFEKFGLLDRMYDEGINLLNMNIKKNENMTNEDGRYLSIARYNGSPGLSLWGYQEQEGNETHPENTICNRIEGASEGTIFPSYLDKHAQFRIYRKAFCRPVPIGFKEEVVVDSGLPGYLYDLVEDFADTPDVNPDNDCYCLKKEKCLKKGLSDMTPCYYHIPTAMSRPHFLRADPSLQEAVDGLNPDPAKHESRIILQPTVGIPVNVNSRLQINLIMERTTYNSKVTPFNDMAVPLFWTDLWIPSLPSDLALLLKMALQILPVAQTIFVIVLGIGGATTIILSLVATLWTVNQQQQEYNATRRDSADLRIPLGYGQYTAIRILPAIKKITSKTDLFS